MKKFFETPEVSSVELNQTDVIMTSNNITDVTNVNLATWTDDVKGDFSMWQGFNKRN
ncbi:MAG: hypothetical protein J1F63_08045 [Oscillospiraceae bacterium]|nr:hypothetical protein [Oscillospiraceae bacterium]